MLFQSTFFILDSEGSDECIDFTMMYVFLSITTISGSETASIFFNSILFDGKMNLVLVHSRCQNLKFPIVFKNTGKNKTKMKENRFSTKSILVFGVILKQNNSKYMKFSLNV